MCFMFQCVITFLGIKPIPAYYGAYMFPPEAERIGWALAFVPISLIPLTMIVQFFIKVGSFNVSDFCTWISLHFSSTF